MSTARMEGSERTRPPAPPAYSFTGVAGLLALTAGFIVSPPAQAQWENPEVVVLAGSSADEWTNRFSVALDAEDSPHAIWTDGSLVYYSRETAGEWIPAIEIGFDDAVYGAHAIAIVPSTTTPVVLYSRRPIGDPSGDLQLATWNGDAFDHRPLTGDELSEYGPALAMDASGAYHAICVSEIGGQWRLRYLTDVTGKSEDRVIDVGSLGGFGSGASPSIAVEADGTAHIAYRGIGSGGYRIHYATNGEPGGETWSWEPMTTGNAEDLSSDIEVDATGGVHLAISGNDCFGCSPRTYYLHQPEGGPWDPFVFIPLGTGLTAPSLAVDRHGTPHVAMAEVTGNIYTGRLYYAGASGLWVPVLIVGEDHATPSLGVDSEGFGHLVCTTGPNTGVEDVLYLRSGGVLVGLVEPNPVLPLIRVAATPNPFTESIRFALPAGPGLGGPDGVIRIHDPAGRLVRSIDMERGVGAGGSVIWDGRDESGVPVPSGVYFARHDAGGGVRSTTIVRSR